MPHLVALTAGGGIPLFNRTIGSINPLPSPTVGSLYAIHKFVQEKGANLRTTTTASAKLAWKCYHDQFLLFLVAADDAASDNYFEAVLDLAFGALMMTVGQEQLMTLKSEQLRRSLRSGYRLMDTLLSNSPFLGPQLGMAEMISCTLADDYQDGLNSFAEALGARYAWLTVQQRICVATDDFWQLSAQEIVLLSTYVRCQPFATARDAAVFLPDTSPTQPYRLVTVQLSAGVDVCVLCGPHPLLDELLTEFIEPHWGHLTDKLKLALESVPRNVPQELVFPSALLAFLLVDTSKTRSLLCLDAGRSPAVESFAMAKKRSKKMRLAQMEDGVADADVTAESQQRAWALLAWYRWNMSGAAPATTSSVADAGDRATSPPPESPSSRSMSPDQAESLPQQLIHTVGEAYRCAEQAKFYLVLQEPYQLFAMFEARAPTYSLGGMAREVLATLSSAAVL